MPHKVWAVGEEVLAADFQSYLQNQTVPQFPNVAARDTWAAPPVGALCVTTDTGTVWQRGASAWAALKPWGSAWGLVVAQTALTPVTLTGTVSVAPVVTIPVPAGRNVRVTVGLQINLINATVAHSVQRQVGATAEEYGRIGDFGTTSTTMRHTVMGSYAFATVVANQQTQVKISRTAIGSTPASDLVAGYVSVTDEGPSA